MCEDCTHYEIIQSPDVVLEEKLKGLCIRCGREKMYRRRIPAPGEENHDILAWLFGKDEGSRGGAVTGIGFRRALSLDKWLSMEYEKNLSYSGSGRG